MKKLLPLILLVLLCQHISFAQVNNAHHNLTMAMNRHNQFMQNSMNAKHTQNSLVSELKLAKKALKKQNKQTQKFEKKLLANQEKLNTDLSPSKKEKLLNENKELEKNIESSKVLSGYLEDKVEEEEKLKALRKRNRNTK